MSSVHEIVRSGDDMPELERRESWYEEEGDDEKGKEVTQGERLQVEACFRALSTEVFVCKSLANLYISKGAEASWKLHYMGIPVILLDTGEARSRTNRGIRIVLAERGSCFTLWQDKIDNLSAYKFTSPSFHTMCLSTDHTTHIGLSFDCENAAKELGSHIERLISCPENINLSIPKGKGKQQRPQRPQPRVLPAKSHISLPCCFQHITSVGATDKHRYVSLQKLLPPSNIIPEKN